MKLSVIGTGYLGATHAAAMASLQHSVVGIDLDAFKVATLNAGLVPFYEPGLGELVRAQRHAGRLRFSTSFKALDDCDVHFVCVGTPQRHSDFAADLSQVESAIQAISTMAKPGSLIVGKSTVPVGTAERLSRELASYRPDLELAWNPEFLREGFAVKDTLQPDRIVVGVSSDRTNEVLKNVYEKLVAQGIPWICADLPTAELVKVAANAFLATKISFINAMAEICETAGADVTVLAKAIGHDPRIGHRFLQAGVGFGGGCLPKDIRAFMARAEEINVGHALDFLRSVDVINLRARQRVIDILRHEMAAEPMGKRIAVMGAAFKPGSDDVRDSPALDIAEKLHAAGAIVVIHDPKAITSARQHFPALKYAESIEAAASNADAILHLTEWPEYRCINPRQLRCHVRQPLIIDGRNTLDEHSWVSAGWRFRAMGRPPQSALSGVPISGDGHLTDVA